MSETYLLLGSNLERRTEQLRLAFEAIEKEVGPVLLSSSLYETAAWGVENQPDFLNQVLFVNTELRPDELLTAVHKIEKKLGRVRNSRWGARTIDIDILFYEDLIVEQPNLMIPHPYLHLRKFTLIPLMEISPHLIHPILKKSIEQLLTELNDELEVRVYKS